MGVSLMIEMLGGVGQLLILVAMALVLYKISKFVDALTEMVKKDK